MPDTLTEIGSHAFAKCTALTEIELNEGLSNIEDRVFEDCTALKRVFIPVSVELVRYPILIIQTATEPGESSITAGNLLL